MSETVMQASLPMYDFPETRKYTDAWWSGVARHMRKQGIAGVPDLLAYESPLTDLWKQENLLLSQCCGFNVIHGYDKYLSVLMVTDWDAEGCETNKYASQIVVHEDSPYDNIGDLKDKTAVINGIDSHSGMTTLMHEVQALSVDGHFFKAIHNSGAHAESLKLIQNKQADVAAIDCVTFALLKRYRPAALEGIRVLSLSKSATAHPYVTSINTNLASQERMQTALAEAFADTSLTKLREAILLKDGLFPKLTRNDDPYKEMANGFRFDSRLLEALT